MLELSGATPCSDERPSIILKHPEYLTYLHRLRISTPWFARTTNWWKRSYRRIREVTRGGGPGVRTRLRGDDQAPPADLGHGPPPIGGPRDPHRRTHPTLPDDRSPSRLRVKEYGGLSLIIEHWWADGFTMVLGATVAFQRAGQHLQYSFSKCGWLQHFNRLALRMAHATLAKF